MPIELFYGQQSCAFAALVALEEAGASYRPLQLDLAKGDQRSAEYRIINPLGRVPALRCEQGVLTELNAILVYIVTRFPEAGLLPRDDEFALGKVHEILSWFSTSFHLSVAQMARGERFSPEVEVHEKLKEPARRSFAEQLARLEDICLRSTGDGLINGRFGVVDAFNLVIGRWANKFLIDVTPFPCWQAKLTRDMGRSSVKRALEVEKNGVIWIQTTAA